MTGRMCPGTASATLALNGNLTELHPSECRSMAVPELLAPVYAALGIVSLNGATR